MLKNNFNFHNLKLNTEEFMDIRPAVQPSDGSYASFSPEDQAIRHVNTIMYVIPEVRGTIQEKKSKDIVLAVAAPLVDHIEGLAKLRTKLKNMDAQISVQRVKEALKKFQASPSRESLTTVARETYQLGSHLNVGGCHVAGHVEEIRVATNVLAQAVKKEDSETIQNQRQVIHTLMHNLINSPGNNQFLKDIQQLNQNHVLFSTIVTPTTDDVAEWQKALDEFPPVT